MGSSNSTLKMPLCQGVNIEELSIAQLKTHLSKGSFTSTELAQCYLKRIQLLNPRVRAVIETNPDALALAAAMDSERATGKLRSAIHGIPFIVKDNIATSDKMQTTAGSAALVGTTVPADAAVVAALRAAGGILLAKANLSEWASMRASWYAEAYSSRGGQNRNPYNLAEHPGGSSSGSASALATNMCAFSIGTETDGSVMFPADRNAVVGIKPSVGFASCVGVIPEAPSFDTVGPFGRSVEDATVVLDIMANRGENGGKFAKDYVSFLAKQDVLKGAKFGLPWKRTWEMANRSERYKSEYNTLMGLTTKLERAGAKVVRVDFPSAEEIISPHGWDWSYAEGEPGSKLSELEVANVEFYRSLREYLSKLGNNTKKILSLEDVIAYNIKHTDTEGGVPGTHDAWPTGQDGLDAAVEAKDEDESVYREALEYIQRQSRERGIDAALRYEDDKLDGLLVPLQAEGGVACSVAAKAGYPMISIPVSVAENGVPFGIGIIQTAWREDLLIRYGSAIEDLLLSGGHARHKPTFRNLDATNYTYVGGPPRTPSRKFTSTIFDLALGKT
jgi:amidase